MNLQELLETYVGPVKARVMFPEMTEAQWLSVNPILFKGERAIVVFANGLKNEKVGDGVRRFNQLPYYLNASSEIPFFGSAQPSDTPTPSSGAGFWIAVTPGTYTNFGGVQLATNQIGVISRNASGQYSIKTGELFSASYLTETDLTKVAGVNGQMLDRTQYQTNRSVNPNSPYQLMSISGYWASRFMEVVAGQTYIASWTGGEANRSFHFTDDNGNVLSGGNWGRNTTKVAPSGATKLRMTVKYVSEDDIPADLKIQQGNTVTAGTDFDGWINKIRDAKLYAERATLALTANSALAVANSAQIPVVGTDPLSIINIAWFDNQLGYGAGDNGQLFRWSAITNGRAIRGSSPWDDISYPTFKLSEKMSVIPSTAYTLSWTGGVSSRTYQWLGSDGTTILGGGFWNRNATMTSPVGANFFRFTARNGVDETADPTNVKFERGSSVTDGVEFQGYVNRIKGSFITARKVEIVESLSNGATMEVAGDSDNSVLNKKKVLDNIQTEAINGQMFDRTVFTINRAVNGASPWQVITNADYALSAIIPVVAGQTYTLSWTGGAPSKTYHWLNASGTVLGGAWTGSRNATMTAPEGAVGFRFTCKFNTEEEIPADTKFEQGSTRTEGTDYSDRVINSIFGFRIGSPDAMPATYGKTVITSGDSLTANNSSNSGGSIDKPNVLGSWPAIVANTLGWADTRNVAKWFAFIRDWTDTQYSEDTLSYNTDSHNNTWSNQIYSILRYKRDNPSYNPHLMINLGGGNDIGQAPNVGNNASINTFLGNWDDMFVQYTPKELGLLDMSNAEDAAIYEALKVKRRTFYGAMKWWYEALLTAFPNILIMWCGTPQRDNENMSKRLEYFTEAMRRVCRFYGQIYIDSTYESSISWFSETRSGNGWDADFYTYDNIHRGTVGNQMLGDFLARRIDREFYVKPPITANRTT